MLLVVAVGDVALHVLETAVPSGVSILLANLNLSFPYRMRHEEFLCHQTTARQGIGVYVAVIVLVAQFLLLIAIALVTVGIVGIEINCELSYLARVVEIHLVFGRPFGSIDTAVLQTVIHIAVSLQVIVIVAPSLHVVVGVLIEAAKRVVVIQLVVEAETAFEEWIVNLVLLLIGNYP